MRILLINTLYHPYNVGGAEISVQNLAEYLVREGHSVRVLTLNKDNNIKRNVINGVEVCYCPLKNIYWPFGGSKKISSILKFFWHILDNYNPFMRKIVLSEIKNFKPDVVHTNNISGFSVSVWDVIKKENIPLIHTSRDYYLFHPNTTLFKNNKNMGIHSLSVKFWSYIKKINSLNVDCYVGISNYIRIIHEENKFFLDANKYCIYNSINPIKKTRFSEGKKRIGYIGRLSLEKGFDEFCDIAEIFQDEFDFYAAGRFSGESNNINFLKSRASNLNIHLMGYIGVEEFINTVDAVILPIKWNEPFGRVVVECAVAGLHVYTNRVGGVSELFYLFDNIHDLSDFKFYKDVSCSEEYNEKNFENMNYEYVKIYSKCLIES